MKLHVRSVQLAYRKPGRAIRARRALAAAGITVAISAAAPAGAAAKIIPGRSIAGVKLGDRAAKVAALLGKPGELQRNGGGEQNWLYFGKRDPVDWVTVQAKRGRKIVEGIETADRKQRTSKGIGPGSSLRALKRAYPHVTCRRGSLGATYLSCWILTSVNGQKIPTNFVLAPGKPVSLVDIGQIGERNLAPGA